MERRKESVYFLPIIKYSIRVPSKERYFFNPGLLRIEEIKDFHL